MPDASDTSHALSQILAQQATLGQQVEMIRADVTTLRISLSDLYIPRREFSEHRASLDRNNVEHRMQVESQMQELRESLKWLSRLVFASVTTALVYLAVQVLSHWHP